MSLKQTFRWAVWLTAAALLFGGLASAIYFRGLTPGSKAGEEAGGTGEKGRKELDVVSCFGHVDAEYGVVPLAPAQPGRVSRVLVREGDRVAAGAVLLQMDDRAALLGKRKAELAVRAAELRVAEAEKAPSRHKAQVGQQKAAVRAAHHRVEMARRALEKQRGLSEARFASTRDVEAATARVEELRSMEQAEADRLAELELDEPKRRIDQAAMELSLERLRLEQAELQVAESAVRAPHAGTVLRVLVGPGTLLGAESKTPAIQFLPDGPRIVRAEVEQEFARHVAVGATAQIEDDTASARAWTGKVRRVADWYAQRRPGWEDSLQPSDVRTVECIIDLDGGQPPLRMGQRVRVKIKVVGRP